MFWKMGPSYISENGTLPFPTQVQKRQKKIHSKEIPYISRNVTF